MVMMKKAIQIFFFIDVTLSLRNAKTLARYNYEGMNDKRCNPVHPSMKKSNKWAYLGKRIDANIKQRCGHGVFGGYIIEAREAK